MRINGTLINYYFHCKRQCYLHGKQVNYCVLNEEGRKIFIESFEERLESVFMHPKLKRKVSYRTALKLDCYKLIKNILEEKEFVPFSLKEGM